jgi:hypothetical protein
MISGTKTAILGLSNMRESGDVPEIMIPEK